MYNSACSSSVVTADDTQVAGDSKYADNACMHEAKVAHKYILIRIQIQYIYDQEQCAGSRTCDCRRTCLDS